MHGSAFVTDLALVLCVAGVTAVLARALKQSTVLGYLLAGLIVGPYIPIPIFADAGRVSALAEFGVILVMFALGLEFRIAKLMRVLPVSGLTGLVQVGFLTWCGFSLGSLFGWGTVESVFLGASIAISSTMVVSKVFDQVEVERDARQHVLGVLVVQDVLAILLIAAMTAIAAGGGLAPLELAGTIGRLAAVLVAMTVGGLLVVPRLVRAVAGLRSREILSVVAIGLSFGMAMLGESFGYSAALGAFLAGILVAESGRAAAIEPLVQPLRDVFASVFFVSIGMSVDPRVAFELAPAAGLVVLVVVLAQLTIVSVAGVFSGLGLRRSVTAGLALGQIGEFSFILATIGIEAGAVRPELQSVLVSVAVVTAFTTPHFLGSADRVVRSVDRRLPHRVQHLLSLYESWLEGTGVGLRDTSRNPGRRALKVLALDALGLLLLLAACVAWLLDVAQWVEARFHLPSVWARTSVISTALLVAFPLMVGLARNTVTLARWTGESVLALYPERSPAALIAAHATRGMVAMGLLLAVGMPSIAVMRPLMDAAYGEMLLVVVAIWVGMRLWRDAGAMQTEFRSGVEELAQIVARQAGGGRVRAKIKGLQGLETARSLPVQAGSLAAGRTLAELDLRARTGATVVAIQGPGAQALLPTGQERLSVGDTLALVGSAQAVARARKLLTEPAEQEPAAEPEPGA
jgi:CPA2 family monovalent cation:H+ antiporter-2